MKKEWNNKIERICAVGVCGLVVGIMLWLWSVSVMWTQTFWSLELGEYTDAYMFRVRDGVKSNILFLVILSVVLIALCKMAQKWLEQWHITLLLIFEMIATVVFSWSYVCNLQAYQWADFGNIVQISRQFLAGDYSSFAPGNYMATYPHQLGLVCLMMVITKIAGTAYAISAFQFLNCLCVALFLLGGYRAVHIIWRRKGIDIVYLLIQGMCLPLYFYTPLVYGEIISTVLMMVCIIQVLTMLKKQKFVLWRAIVLLLCMGLAMCFRKNSIIVIIAIGIIIIVTVIKLKKWKLVGLLFFMAVSLLFPKTLETVCFNEYVQDAAMPSIVWVYIGIQGGSGFGYGAYDGKAGALMEEAGYNPEIAAEMAKEVIAERIGFFAENPRNAIAFLREKILWQWEAPTYMCFSNTRFFPEGYPKGFAYDIYFGKLRERVNNFMDEYQSFIYLTFAIGVLGVVVKREDFMGLIWAIIFLGGFFFLIIWEAKTRYTYPYFIMMMPMCAYGIWFLGNIFSYAREKILVKMKEGRDGR